MTLIRVLRGYNKRNKKESQSIAGVLENALAVI